MSCLGRNGETGPFYILHPKKHLTLALGFPSNAEDFEIDEDCGQRRLKVGKLQLLHWGASFAGCRVKDAGFLKHHLRKLIEYSKPPSSHTGHHQALRVVVDIPAQTLKLAEI
jgi:hypothetical protein